jgi:hypothetical protein
MLILICSVCSLTSLSRLSIKIYLICLEMSDITNLTIYPPIPLTRMLLWITAQPVRCSVPRQTKESYYSFFLRWALCRNIEVEWDVMDSSGTAGLPVTCVPIRA